MDSKRLKDEAVGELRNRFSGKSIVLTNGCFDLLHVGHTRYLAAAKQMGDLLVVGVNGDDSVRKLKGASRPINSAEDRAEVLAALAVVDYVVIFPEMRATQLISRLRPHCYVKGGDYTLNTLDPDERAMIVAVGAEIRLVPLTPGQSTTRMIRALNS